MFSLAIVGSRVLSLPNQITTAYMLIRGVIREQIDQVGSSDRMCIISGGADGIDSLAAGAAGSLATARLIFRPEERRWAPNGYKARNTRIAEACDELVCIQSRQSKSYGSGWTADYAEEIGKPVHRVWV